MKKSYIALIVVFVIGLFNYKNIILLFSLTYILLGCNKSHEKFSDIKENETIDSIVYNTYTSRQEKKIVIKDSSKIKTIKDTLQNSNARNHSEFVKLPACTGTMLIYTSNRKLEYVVRDNVFINKNEGKIYSNKSIPSIIRKLGKV